MVVIIWGVSSSGKTTVGKLLAEEVGWKFYDADDFHPASNIEKMKHGHPLTDEDRAPWLDKLRQRIEQSLGNRENAVLACSALKKKYRDHLRVSSEVRFAFLHGTYAQVSERSRKRRNHFFDPKLLESQFADLEEPRSPEDSLVFEIDADPHQIVEKIKASLPRGVQ
jgi:gluconokinase